MNWLQVTQKVQSKFINSYFISKKSFMKSLRFNIILKLKTIHGRTHRNKIKKPC